MFLKTIAQSPGSATIINAISTGCGSAFGIKLHVTAEVKLTGSKSTINCSTDRNIDTTLMEKCVIKVLDKFRDNFPEHEFDAGVSVKTSSTLPVASGLSSSSATSNAVIMATVEALKNEFFHEPIQDFLKPHDLINMGVDASLEAGVTITGAFDDASASFYGGYTVTNNVNRKILKMDKLDEQNILVFMPNRKSLTAQSDVRRMKLISPQVKLAFQEALKGNLYDALTLNGILYCASLGFNPNMALDAIDAGAKAAGLSGTGPSFVAVSGDKELDNIADVWSSYPGEIIRTEVDNTGTKVIGSE
jgi:shikimate kinase